MLQDAIALRIVKGLETATSGTRNSKIRHDIQDYHASTGSLEQLEVRQLAVYHLVPAPQNYLFEQIFRRDLPSGTILTDDRMLFELPAGSQEINWN